MHPLMASSGWEQSTGREGGRSTYGLEVQRPRKRNLTLPAPQNRNHSSFSYLWVKDRNPTGKGVAEGGCQRSRKRLFLIQGSWRLNSLSPSLSSHGHQVSTGMQTRPGDRSPGHLRSRAGWVRSPRGLPASLGALLHHRFGTGCSTPVCSQLPRRCLRHQAVSERPEGSSCTSFLC